MLRQESKLKGIGGRLRGRARVARRLGLPSLSLLVFPSLALLSGCANLGEPEVGDRIGDVEITAPTPLSARTDAMYGVLVGELASQRRQFQTAADAYSKASAGSPNVELAERAVRYAILAENDAQALLAAQRWVKLAPKDAAARLTLVRLHLRNNELDAAEREARQYIVQGPGQSESFEVLTNALLDEADQARASTLIQRVAQHYPEWPESHYSVSLVAVEAGQVEVALPAAQRAVQLRPDWVEAQVLLARVKLRSGDKEGSRAAIERLLRDHPEYPNIRLNYARMLVELREPKAAKQQFIKVLEQSPDHADALYMLGLLELQQKELGSAADRFVRLVRSGQRRSEAAYYLGLIAEERQHFDDAISWYQQVTRGRQAMRAQLRSAVLLEKIGRGDDALNHLRELRGRNENLAPRVLLAEGNLLMDRGDTAAAEAAYSKGLSLRPADADLLYARSMAREKIGEIDSSMADLRTILKSDPKHVHALNALGYMLSNHSSRYQEALGYVSQALALSPNEPAIIDSHGWLLFKLKRYPEARAQLQKAYDGLPDPEVAAHLGEVLWVLGDKEQAQRIWQEGLSRDPEHDVLLSTLKRLAPELLPTSSEATE